MDSTFTFTVNGQKKAVTTDPKRSLLEVLREDLQLTGTRYGCGEGRCGACTVLLDGKRTLTCNTPVSDADKKTILTIEGLADGEKLHPVQEAFLAERAFQCGYCTSGMIMSTIGLMKELPQATDAQIVAWMNANICRCNSYPRILNAVKAAVKAGGGR